MPIAEASPESFIGIDSMAARFFVEITVDRVCPIIKVLALEKAVISICFNEWGSRTRHWPSKEKKHSESESERNRRSNLTLPSLR